MSDRPNRLYSNLCSIARRHAAKISGCLKLCVFSKKYQRPNRCPVLVCACTRRSSPRSGRLGAGDTSKARSIARRSVSCCAVIFAGPPHRRGAGAPRLSSTTHSVPAGACARRHVPRLVRQEGGDVAVVARAGYGECKPDRLSTFRSKDPTPSPVVLGFRVVLRCYSCYMVRMCVLLGSYDVCVDLMRRL